MSSRLLTALRAPRIVVGTTIALSVTVSLAACAEEADAPDIGSLAAGELDGWTALHEQPHESVLAYDQVAVASTDGVLAWLTRAGESGAALSVWTSADGDTPVETPVVMPGGVAIPVALAADPAGWSGVAVTRDDPDGANTGLVAWRSPEEGSAAPGGNGPGSAGGAATTDPAPEGLRLPEAGVPGVVTAARAAGVDVVAGVAGGEVVTWVSGAEGWTAGTPELDVDGGVVNSRVGGTGDRFLLAAVDATGAPYLWTSTDGFAWTAIPVEAPDASLAAVGIVTGVGPSDAGEGLVAWLVGEPSATEVPREAAEVVVQRVEGTTITDAGTISAGDDGTALVDVNAAARRGEWLVIGGARVGDGGAVRPGLWASAGGEWAQSAQADLVDQSDSEFRALDGGADGLLYGVITGRSSIDVDVWRSAGER